MDFAIASVPGRPHRQSGEASPAAAAFPPPSPPETWPETWEVLLLRQNRGNDVVSRLASFGHRAHAEAFLADLLAQAHAGA